MVLAGSQGTLSSVYICRWWALWSGDCSHFWPLISMFILIMLNVYLKLYMKIIWKQYFIWSPRAWVESVLLSWLNRWRIEVLSLGQGYVITKEPNQEFETRLVVFFHHSIYSFKNYWWITCCLYEVLRTILRCTKRSSTHQALTLRNHARLPVENEEVH